VVRTLLAIVSSMHLLTPALAVARIAAIEQERSLFLIAECPAGADSRDDLVPVLYPANEDAHGFATPLVALLYSGAGILNTFKQDNRVDQAECAIVGSGRIIAVDVTASIPRESCGAENLVATDAMIAELSVELAASRRTLLAVTSDNETIGALLAASGSVAVVNPREQSSRRIVRATHLRPQLEAIKMGVTAIGRGPSGNRVLFVQPGFASSASTDGHQGTGDVVYHLQTELRALRAHQCN
jgi:hypothetical protein